MSASAHGPNRLCLLGQALVLSIAALLLSVAPGSALDEAAPSPVVMSTKALLLDPEDPKRLRVGHLSWRGGIDITARGRHFGGLSSLMVSDDGSRLLAISDRGYWLTADLVYGTAGQLTGIADGQMARLRDLNGAVISDGRLQDAESLAPLNDGSILVSFERRHRIWRYQLDDGRPTSQATAWPQPEGLDEAPYNGGLEALTDLADGGLLALTEDLDDGPGKAGFLWRHDAWSRLTYQPEAGFKPTAATRLPGSDDLLVLERAASSFSGFHVRLLRLAAGDVQPGAQLRGEELAHWGAPLSVDNFECLAARRGPDGEILVYLLSDDNFSLFQRTLLLMFALED
jgi:hypothetical protein